MKVEHTITLQVPKAAALEAILSPEYLDALTHGLEPIGAIEETVRESSPGHLRRTLRYTAPTAGKIPSFLSKWQSKAPAHVHWQEQGNWDLEAGRLEYTIRAEIPQRWQEYYETRGVMELQESGEEACVMRTALEFEVQVFGLGGMIERAVRREVEKILGQQAQVTKEFVER